MFTTGNQIIMEAKPTLDEYDLLTPEYFDNITGCFNMEGSPATERIEAYQDEITLAWRNILKDLFIYD